MRAGTNSIVVMFCDVVYFCQCYEPHIMLNAGWTDVEHGPREMVVVVFQYNSISIYDK